MPPDTQTQPNRPATPARAHHYPPVRRVAARFPRSLLVLALAGGGAVTTVAQTTEPAAAQTIAPVVVTGSRIAADPRSLPMAIDVVDGDTLREQNLQVNLSESMQRVPGINVQNRSNYAQDLQISSRGFGARASFGVRGIRLFTDGIPASQPDGQGQVSHFGLASTDRVEVLRGPFSVLYGNASGGVIQIFTEAAPVRATAQADLAFGSNSTQRMGVKVGAPVGGIGIVAEASQFETDGLRPQSGARKTLFNGKLSGQLGEGRTRWTLLVNSVDVRAQDALGLTRAEFNANPDQTTAVATQFNTRKNLHQDQAGIRVEHTLSAAQSLAATAYAGSRGATQWQAIAAATQSAATHPGGVIDFDRDYSGVDLRYAARAAWGSLVVGASADWLGEDRRGYENFIGSTLGVTGNLRRNERNRVSSRDAYAQGEWRFSASGAATLGVRHSDVRFVSDDHYIIVGKNPDDSGRVRYSRTTPAFGLTWRPHDALTLYSSIGRGFETPTLNELAYRASGGTGLNFALRPATSDSVEAGAKWQRPGWRGTLAVFDTTTRDEIVTLTNSGGRSTFQNAGRTQRRGAELALSAALTPEWQATLAATTLSATYRDTFKTCVGAPCTTPSVTVAAGNRLPGVPGQSAFAELKWAHPKGWSAAAEVKYQGRLWVNDANSDAAAAYTVLNLRAGYVTQWQQWRLEAGLRVDNVADKRYAATVIVNEGNARFFEPAAGRAWLAVLSASMRF